MIAEAEQWYAQYNGNDASNNLNGMTLQQLYDLVVQIGLHFQATSIDPHVLRAWLALGYPVIVAGAETGFYDLALGDVVPYPWTPSGSHIIVLTGVAADGNFLVRDTANVTDLNNPNTLRPGPRKYDAQRMQLLSATVIVPPWKVRPPVGFDPTQNDFVRCKSASTNFAFTCSANLHFLVHSILSTNFSKSITLPSRHVGRQMHQKRGLPEAMPPGRPSSLKNAGEQEILLLVMESCAIVSHLRWGLFNTHHNCVEIRCAMRSQFFAQFLTNILSESLGGRVIDRQGNHILARKHIALCAKANLPGIGLLR
jgi:hypothetical protein